MSEESIVPGPVTGKSTRREILGTGVKLGYAAPLVAASFKLSASGALATGNHDDDENCCGWLDHERNGLTTFRIPWKYALCHDGEFKCVWLYKDEAEAHEAHGDTVIPLTLDFHKKVCIPECGGGTVSL